MSIWFKNYTLEDIKIPPTGIDEKLGIEIIEIGSDYIICKMPVDERTKQPMGLLHGGASCVLAESTASIAAFLVIDPKKKSVVGLNLLANHLKSARNGFVYATAKPKHIGKSTSVWDVQITNEEDQTISQISFTAMHKDI